MSQVVFDLVTDVNAQVEKREIFRVRDLGWSMPKKEIWYNFLFFKNSVFILAELGLGCGTWT